MRVVSRRQVEAKVKELREVSAGDDSAAIKAKIEELQKEVMAIGQVRRSAPAVEHSTFDSTCFPSSLH